MVPGILYSAAVAAASMFRKRGIHDEVYLHSVRLGL